MLRLRRSALALLLAATALVGCGDDDDDGGTGGNTLTTEQATTLANALNQSGILAGDEALLFPFVVSGATEYGPFTVPQPALRAVQRQLAVVLMSAIGGTYDGTAFQAYVNVTVDGQNVRFCESGLIGWKGLSTSTQTVDELLLVGGIQEDVAGCTDGITGDIADGDAAAAFWDGVSETTYFGTSGTATLATADFGGGTTDCSTDIPGFGTVTCSYQYGSMAGSFAFTAQDLSVPEPPSVTFPETDYDLPAVKVALSGTFTTTPTLRSLHLLPLRTR